MPKVTWMFFLVSSLLLFGCREVTSSKKKNNPPPVIEVQNFMNGGTYPTTPTNPVWLTVTNGDVPENAAVYRTEAGITTYHCRVFYQQDFYDGELIPGKGCDIPNGKTVLRFTMYDVLLNPYSQ